MTKYNKDNVKKFIESIEKGNGRVNSCKIVGISYETFIYWQEHFPEFPELLKKAEEVKNVKLKETCEAVIMNAATDKNHPTWQAAAWMLERKFPHEFANKTSVQATVQNIEPITGIIIQEISKEEYDNQCKIVPQTNSSDTIPK